MSARQIDDALLPPGALPARVGKYAIERLLGEGAMGVVYLGRDEAIGRPVAVKTIRRALLAPQASDLAPLARFRNEAQAAGRLNHPNIVSIYEYGEDRGTLFLAMEYVEGAALVESTSRSVRLPLADVMSILVQLLDALHSAHEQGVWHRDVKPANLIITPEGRLKVTDFGIARIDSGDLSRGITVMSAVMGSPGYMAPERYTDARPDRRVDVFAAGVLLYELLTGAAPFMGSQDAVMVQVLHRDPPAPSKLPIREAPPLALDAVIARAIAKRPEDRYASAREMREALMQAMGEVPISRTVSPATCARLLNLAGVVVAAKAAPSMPGASHSALSQAPAVAAPAAAAKDTPPLQDLLRRCADKAKAPNAPESSPVPGESATACESFAGKARTVEATLLLDRSGIDDDFEHSSPPASIPALMRAVQAHGHAGEPVEPDNAGREARNPAADPAADRLAAHPAEHFVANRQEPAWWPTQMAPRATNGSTGGQGGVADTSPRPPAAMGAAARSPLAGAAALPIPPAPQPAQAPRAHSGVPGSASGPIDASLLSQLVELLRPVLGAMAELTVRHTARRHGSAMGLVEALAADAVPDEERAAFLSAAHPLLDHLPRPAQAVPAAAASGSRPAPPAGPLPVLGATPMRPGDEQAAQSALARLVGPIATLFVRRAAARAHSREEFYSTLADLAEGSVDRKQVLSALWKSH